MPGEGFGTSRYDTLATYQVSPTRTGLLQRDRLTGKYSVGATRTGSIAPLENFTEARLIGAFPDGRETVAVIEGSAPGCPVTYKYVISDDNSFQWTRPLGDCSHVFRPTMLGSRLVMVEQGVTDPLMFAYQGHRITEPVRSSRVVGVRSVPAPGLPPLPPARRMARDTPRIPAAEPPTKNVPMTRVADRVPGAVGAPMKEGSSPMTGPNVVFDPK